MGEPDITLVGEAPRDEPAPPLRKILADVQDAHTAPMLEHGVKGTDQISRTQMLAQSVPDLAVRYMTKLGLPVDTTAPPRAFPEPGRPQGSAGWR